jgi:hypothetical protein
MASAGRYCGSRMIVFTENANANADPAFFYACKSLLVTPLAFSRLASTASASP